MAVSSVPGDRRSPIDSRLQAECEMHYKLLMHVADLSPQLRINELKTERLSDGNIKVLAVIQNQGFLSTYVTRQALKSSATIRSSRACAPRAPTCKAWRPRESGTSSESLPTSDAGARGPTSRFEALSGL
jgi:hypothetical protein